MLPGNWAIELFLYNKLKINFLNFTQEYYWVSIVPFGTWEVFKLFLFSNKIKEKKEFHFLF